MDSSTVVQRSWLAHTEHTAWTHVHRATVITAGHCRPVSPTAAPRLPSRRLAQARLTGKAGTRTKQTSTSPNDVHRFARVAHVIASDWQLLLSMHLIISCAQQTTLQCRPYLITSEHIGVDLAGILRETHGEHRRWVGAEWDGVWWGVSPLQPTRGFGAASWAPTAGSGSEPRPKTDFGVFWWPQSALFCIYMTKIWGGQFALASPTPNSGGTCPPRPPVIYAHASELFFRAMYL